MGGDRAGSGSRCGRPRLTGPEPQRPVARVAVDVSLPHLDRLFDYAIGDALDDVALPGVRVKVRFAGRLVGGFLVQRVEHSEHPRLSPLAGVVSAERVLADDVASLVRLVADHYAGTFADVVRLAVPPRHARTERETPADPAHTSAARPLAERLAYLDGGTGLLDALADRRAPRAVVAMPPARPSWSALATMTAAAAVAGGTVVIVPTARDVQRTLEALTELLDPAHVVALTADVGPAERYRRFLSVVRGQRRVVVGTRSAAFAPVQDLATVIVLGGADGNHIEPRAPYPHAFTVAALRAHQVGAAFVSLSHSPSVEDIDLVERSWARLICAPRPVARALAGTVVAVDDRAVARSGPAAIARIPPDAYTAARRALADNMPVLVSVVREGYQPALACDECRAPARCTSCAGPIGRAGPGVSPACTWCAAPATDFTCRACGGRRLRQIRVGAQRTADEIGRAFPEVPVVVSSGQTIRDQLPAGARLVVATGGAEPIVPGGYGAVLLLDATTMLARPTLTATTDALARWTAATALAAEGAHTVIAADAALPVVQAMIRVDPVAFARRERAERMSLGFPPASRQATVTGSAAAGELVERVVATTGGRILGPVRAGDRLRWIIQVPRGRAAALAAELHAALARVSIMSTADLPQIMLDPLDPAAGLSAPSTQPGER